MFVFSYCRLVIYIVLEWKLFLLFPRDFSIVCSLRIKYVWACVGSEWISSTIQAHANTFLNPILSSIAMYTPIELNITPFYPVNIFCSLLSWTHHSSSSFVLYCCHIIVVFSVVSGFVQSVLFYTIAHHLCLCSMWLICIVFVFLCVSSVLLLHSSCQKYKVGNDEWVRIIDRMKNNHFNRGREFIMCIYSFDILQWEKNWNPMYQTVLLF